MGYPTRVQLIDRKASQQWYINFPAALAQAMEFQKGEIVEWDIQDKGHLLLNRTRAESAPGGAKKNAEPPGQPSVAVGVEPGCLPAMAYRRPRPAPGSGLAGLSGTAHPDRGHLRHRAAGRRLVGRLPGILSVALVPDRSICPGRAGHSGPSGPGASLRGRPGRHSPAQDRHQDPRRFARPRSPLPGLPHQPHPGPAVRAAGVWGREASAARGRAGLSRARNAPGSCESRPPGGPR